MAPDRQNVWTDRQTDNAKTISLSQGIIIKEGDWYKSINNPIPAISKSLSSRLLEYMDLNIMPWRVNTLYCPLLTKFENTVLFWLFKHINMIKASSRMMYDSTDFYLLEK